MASNTESLNKIISIIRDIQIRNPFINSFFFGSNADYNALKNVLYPILVVEPTINYMKQSNQTLSYPSFYYGFNIYCLDRLEKGDSTYQENLSDTLYSLRTIIAEIQNHQYYIDMGISLVEDLTYEPVVRFDDDDVMGYQIKLKLKVPERYTPCNSPIAPIMGYTVSLNGYTSQYRLIGATGPTGPAGATGATGPAGATGIGYLQGLQDVLTNGNTSSIGFDMFISGTATSGFYPSYLYFEDQYTTQYGMYMEMSGTQSQLGFFAPNYNQQILPSLNLNGYYTNYLPNESGTLALIEDVNGLSQSINIEINNIQSEIDTINSTFSNYYLNSNPYGYITQSSLNGVEYQSNKDIPNGYAGLDGNGYIPTSILPDSVVGNVKYKGTFNPLTTTFSATSSNLGWYYINNGVSATYSGLYFQVGDWMISEGTYLSKVANTDAVMTVNGRMGNVVINSNDISSAGGQLQLSGNGFVKVSGTAVSYDNSSYYLSSNPSGYITASSLNGYISGSLTSSQIAIASSSNSITGSSNLTWDNINNILNVNGLSIGGKNQNTFVGNESLYNITTGSSNNSFGYSTLYNITTGSYNNAFGNAALGAISTASHNNAFGLNALQNNTTGTYNNAFGNFTLLNNLIGNNNNAFGYYALYSSKGNNNNAFGYYALRSTTTGNDNVAIGYNALSNNTTGYNNIGIGNGTSLNAISDYNSIVIGYGATGKGPNTVVIGNNNTLNNYFNGNIISSAYKITGGTSSQFLKGDGSLDTNSYALSASSSQWITSGSNIYYNTGAVTIGGTGSITQGLWISDGNIPASNSYSINDFLVLSRQSNSLGLTYLVSSTTASQAAYIKFSKARGTLSSPSAVQNGDVLGAFNINGYDGSSYINNASFTFLVNGSVSTGIVPVSYNIFLQNAVGSLQTALQVNSLNTNIYSNTTQVANIGNGSILYATGATILQLSRISSSSNVVMQFTNTSGSVYTGLNTNATQWGVGNSANLTDSTNTIMLASLSTKNVIIGPTTSDNGYRLQVIGSASISGDIVSSTIGALNYANDAAAAAGGVPVGGIYNTSGILKIRLS